PQDYQASNGWVAHTFTEGDQKLQIALLTPQGERKQLTYHTQDSQIVSLSPEGEVAYRTTPSWFGPYGKGTLFIKRLEQFQPTEITGRTFNLTKFCTRRGFSRLQLMGNRTGPSREVRGRFVRNRLQVVHQMGFCPDRYRPDSAIPSGFFSTSRARASAW